MTKTDRVEDLARTHAAVISLGVQLANARAQRDLLASALHSIVSGLENMTSEEFACGKDRLLRDIAREALAGVSDPRH